MDGNQSVEVNPVRAWLAEASRFAAKSESLSRLTEEEKTTLDEFVKFLREEEHKSVG